VLNSSSPSTPLLRMNTKEMTVRVLNLSSPHTPLLKINAKETKVRQSVDLVETKT
jgi:hypothetical protein